MTTETLRDRANRAEAAVHPALRLAWLVHEQAGGAIRELLHRLTPTEKDATLVTLAAAVDIDRTPDELLGWTAADDNQELEMLREEARDWPAEKLRAAHAAHNRGEARLAVIAGEREYQRRRKHHSRRTVAA